MWWSLALFVTAGMAWSRTYLHAHWLLDVTAGSILGVGVALIVCGGVQCSRLAAPSGLLELVRRQLPPRLLQESVLLNAEEREPPASFKVLIADLVSLARLWT